MKAFRLLRMAWAAATVAIALGFAYLEYAPVPSSYATDLLLSIGVYVSGAVLGAVFTYRLETWLSRRRAAEVPIARRVEADALERSAA